MSKFLDVEIEPDREEYQPRGKGTLKVTTRDVDGKPVSAEVSLGLADESVYAISEDLAADPRQFFYGDKRYHGVQTASSFNFRSYRKLVESDRKEGKDENELDQLLGRRDAPRAQAVGSMMTASVQMEGAAAAEMSMAPPAPAMAKMASTDARQLADADTGREGAAAGTVEVRSDFRSTVLWMPDIVTGDDGTVTVDATYPDSLTSWRATARCG